MNVKWLIVCLFVLTSYANERSETLTFCNEVGGVVEYGLPDRSRVDCLTDERAIEAEWAKNWYEAVGQSLHYAMFTGRRATILMLEKTEKDKVYTKRVTALIRHYNLPIDVLSRVVEE